MINYTDNSETWDRFPFPLRQSLPELFLRNKRPEHAYSKELFIREWYECERASNFFPCSFLKKSNYCHISPWSGPLCKSFGNKLALDLVWKNGVGKERKEENRVKEERRVKRKVMLANKRQEKKRSADFLSTPN